MKGDFVLIRKTSKKTNSIKKMPKSFKSIKLKSKSTSKLKSALNKNQKSFKKFLDETFNNFKPELVKAKKSKLATNAIPVFAGDGINIGTLGYGGIFIESSDGGPEFTDFI